MLVVLVGHVTIEGVNVVKKHMRPNPMLGTTGDVVGRVMPIHILNATLVDANGGPSRISIKVEGGVKTCMSKATGAAVGT